MAELRINSAVASDLTNAITDYSVDTQETDGPSDQKETTWTNTKWSQYLGYYKKIPELRSVIDAKATWTVGKGFNANIKDTVILQHIDGFGYDTANTVLENMIRVYNAGGDSYSEIIRDKERDVYNLIPLDPGVMRHVANRQGRIIRFEQTSKHKNPTKKFKPQDIFYLPRNRIADEIHGVSMIEALEWIILAKNEVQGIMKTVMQRHIKPIMMFHLDTDDTTEIAAFKTKMDKAYADGENFYIPKDVVVPELLATAPNATLNPLAWLEYLDKQFYETAGVPKVIVGGASEFTDGATKMAYLAFQQNIEEEQLFIEEQVFAQLGLKINLEFPASIENDLITDKKKDGAMNVQPNETTAGIGR